jgi:hypothetical protein
MRVSKESIIKKRIERVEKENRSDISPEKPRPAATAAPVVQRPKRKLNKKFIFTFAIWLVALIAAMIFLTRGTGSG